MGFKASETLLGIETVSASAITVLPNAGFKASETLLGIETRLIWDTSNFYPGFKASETLLGIETKYRAVQNLYQILLSFKASETLLGIETDSELAQAVAKAIKLQSL